MCYQQNHGTEKNNCADDKCTFICDGTLRCRHFFDFFFGKISFTKFYTKTHVKEENHQYQADDCDHAGVGQEIGKSIMQSRSDNDIWRIAAHRGRTTKVRTEDFCDNDWNRIKLQ